MEAVKANDLVSTAWEILNQIEDPEVPAISIVELGVVRAVEEKNGHLLISITPTYSGCPALQMMEDHIKEAFQKKGMHDFTIRHVLFPPWTTDWMSDETKLRLKNYGIAPPEMSTEEHLRFLLTGRKSSVSCPFCNSTDTRLTSAFGSTACKALHYCNSCHQPFEEFKCH
jgi:ring-1,2-phenylacetyl-CoA epoxidase subunit PaaD